MPRHRVPLPRRRSPQRARRRAPGPFDQLAKGVAREALSEAGHVELELEVAAAAQRMDLWHQPDAALTEARAQLGLLGELTAEPCQIEPFSRTPGLREIRGCIRKQLQWHHQRELAAGRKLTLPRLFVSSTGRPTTVLQGLGFKQEKQYPGLYRSLPALRIYVLVLSEVPRNRSTLLLRMMGGGRILMDAIEEVLALPDDAWEKRIALPWLVRLGFVTPEGAGTKEAAMNEVRGWFDRYERGLIKQGLAQGLQKGRREGRREGRLETQRRMLARLFERRLERPLTAGERARLRERLTRLGEERIAEVLLEASTQELTAWLADPPAT